VAGERCDSYTSEADFILKNGRSFEYAALPRGVRMGRPRECFRNAAALALRKPDMYMYVEGYAVNRWVAMHTVAHAWCIGVDNLVVDPTWDAGAEYFGVPFRHDYLSRVLKARKDRVAVSLLPDLDGGITCITRLSNGLPYKTFYE
jgi:hypothetical protein